MDRNLNIAAIEDNIIWADKKANITQLRKNIDFLPSGIDLVILPEMFSTGFIVDKDSANNLAERNTEDTIKELQNLSNEHRFAIAGSFLARTAGKLYNRAFFIEPSGDETFYDKHHLFRMAGECDIFSAGAVQSPVVRFRGWNIKLLVCYDLRFPVWCRNTKDNNFDLLIFVANWPKARINAWTTLLSARAIENESYVCGVNRCGVDPNGIEYADGTSAIIDYKGKIIGCRNTESKHPQIINAVLDYKKLQSFREKFPAWKDADDFDIVI